MRISAFGAGELGGRVLAKLSGERWAITRTSTRDAALRRIGVIPSRDVADAHEADRIVFALPGSAAQLELLASLPDLQAERLVLVGTMGYHAPYGGRVLPETPSGTSERAAVAARAEAVFRERFGERGVVVRLGGLFHAEKGPAAFFARTRRARLAPADAILPLLHYDDAASLVATALTAASVPPVVLGVVSTPTREGFYTALAEHLGCAPPAFLPPTGEVTHIDRSTVQALLPSPAHPDWRDGFPAVR